MSKPNLFSSELKRLKKPKETYPKIEGIGQLVSSVKYVIFQPAKDDYFEREGGDKLFTMSCWCPTPGKAKKFSTFAKAEAKAKEISSIKGYKLQICELYETDKQFMTNAITEARE